MALQISLKSFQAPLSLLSVFTLNGLNLLMNSVERLCVVAFPIQYYKNSKRIAYSLIVIQYVTALMAIASTLEATFAEPIRYVPDICLYAKGTKFITQCWRFLVL